MGLATSQVRLLALTSRKADVEMQMQLDSKRKSMLTRESSTLAKLYYAKMQQTNIQYATGNGYKDINYNYLMYSSDTNFLYNVAVGNKDDDRKQSNTMILVDSQGRVILDDKMLELVLEVLNYQTTPSPTSGFTLPNDPTINSDTKMKYFVDVKNTFNSDGTLKTPGTYIAKADSRTTEEMVIDAIDRLLSDPNFANERKCEGIGSIKSIFEDLYYGTTFGGNKDTSTKQDCEAAAKGVQVLKTLLRNGGVKDGGTIYVNSTSIGSVDSLNSGYKGGTLSFYTECTTSGVNPLSKIDLQDGYFYTVVTQDKRKTLGVLFCDVNGDGTGEQFVSIDENSSSGSKRYLEQLGNIIGYYGAIFSAAFNGRMKTTTGDSVSHLNVAADITLNNGIYDVKRDNGVITGNSKYNTVTDANKLQEGLRSGVYQLVNVSNVRTGVYSPGQGIDYFKAQNYIVEKIDNDQREAINAWYQSEKAALADKESQWDTEISELSAELTTITTEIESVKKLREDAISSTFKWGSA